MEPGSSNQPTNFQVSSLELGHLSLGFKYYNLDYITTANSIWKTQEKEESVYNTAPHKSFFKYSAVKINFNFVVKSNLQQGIYSMNNHNLCVCWNLSRNQPTELHFQNFVIIQPCTHLYTQAISLRKCEGAKYIWLIRLRHLCGASYWNIRTVHNFAL